MFYKNHQSGFALIEAMIAMVIMALGILGILGVQMRTLSDTSTTVRRAQAIRLIEDLGERMRVNPNAIATMGDYVSDFGASPSVSSCASGCTPGELAAYDMYLWKKSVSDNLPLGQASVFLAPGESTGNRRQLGVMISWREGERHDADANFKSAIDAVKGNGGGGTAASCPANRTCQLQYLPVAGRCPPDSNYPGQYFCVGQ